MALATTHPTWGLGFGDAVWWSRLAQPALQTWAPDAQALRLVEQARPKADPEPKALACYGLLVRRVPTEPEQMLLRFVERRPVSRETTAFLAWCSARLAAHGLTATVADARFAKPLDVDLVLRLAREHEVLITVEEGAIGGFGSHVLHTLATHGALDHGLKVRAMVLPDAFIDQDSPAAMYAKAGLDAKGIVAKVFEALGKDMRRDVVQLKSSPKGA